MTFLELLTQLAQRLGQHQLPINPAATNVARVIDASALHHALATELVGAVFQASQCRQLNGAIDPEPTLAALGAARAKALVSAKLDIDGVQFLEAFCETACELLKDNGPRDQPPRGKPRPQPPVALKPRRRLKPSS